MGDGGVAKQAQRDARFWTCCDEAIMDQAATIKRRHKIQSSCDCFQVYDRAIVRVHVVATYSMQRCISKEVGAVRRDPELAENLGVRHVWVVMLDECLGHIVVEEEHRPARMGSGERPVELVDPRTPRFISDKEDTRDVSSPEHSLRARLDPALRHSPNASLALLKVRWPSLRRPREARVEAHALVRLDGGVRPVAVGAVETV